MYISWRIDVPVVATFTLRTVWWGGGCRLGSFILGPVLKNKCTVHFVSVSVRFALSHCVLMCVRISAKRLPQPPTRPRIKYLWRAPLTQRAKCHASCLHNPYHSVHNYAESRCPPHGIFLLGVIWDCGSDALES